MDLLVAYDISTEDLAGERRLQRVAKVCEQYGVRVQKSVFEARLSATQLERLINDLLEVIVPRSDSVRIYRLNAPVSEARITLGQGMDWGIDQDWIF